MTQAITNISVEVLKVHPRNTEFFDDISGEEYQRFKKSIEDDGLLSPLIVAPDMTVISGHQRLKACKELGFRSVHVIIKDDLEDEDEKLKKLIAANFGRLKNDPVKQAKLYQEYAKLSGVKRGGDRKSKGNNFPLVTLSDIAKELGVEERQLKNIKRLAELPTDFQDLISEGTINATTGYKLIARLSEEEQLSLLSQLPATQRYTQAQVQAEVDKIRQQSDNMVAALKRSITSKEQIIAEKEKTIEVLENVPVFAEPEDTYYTEMKQKMDDAQARERKASVLNDQLERKTSALEKQVRAQVEAHRKELAEMERRLDNAVEAEPNLEDAPEYIAMKKETEGLRAELERLRSDKRSAVQDDRVMRIQGYKTDDESLVTKTEVTLNGLFSSIKGSLCGYVREKDSLKVLAADTKEHLIEQGEAALFTLQTVLKIMGWEDMACNQIN